MQGSASWKSGTMLIEKQLAVYAEKAEDTRQGMIGGHEVRSTARS